MRISEEIEWLQQVFHNLHRDTQDEILDCLYSLAVVTDKDERIHERVRLIRAIETARNELVG